MLPAGSVGEIIQALKAASNISELGLQRGGRALAAVPKEPKKPA
jgi:hypothetical protein